MTRKNRHKSRSSIENKFRVSDSDEASRETNIPDSHIPAANLYWGEGTSSEPKQTYSKDDLNELTQQGKTGSEVIKEFVIGQFLPSPRALIFIVFVASIILTSWLFIQDNSNGHLQNKDGLIWFSNKIAAISGYTFVVLFVLLLVICIKKDKKEK